MKETFQKKIEEIYKSIKEILIKLNKSEILQNYFIIVLKSFFYSNLINNFFLNLNQENIIKYSLPKSKIGEVKKKYKKIKKDAKFSFPSTSLNKKIDENCYLSFKSRLGKDYPDFLKIISEIENEIKINKLKEYLNKKVKAIKSLGKSDKDIHNLYLTATLEAYVKLKKKLPLGESLTKLIKIATKKGLPKISKLITKELMEDNKNMLNLQRMSQNKFEERLYKKWKKPIDLLECLIRVSLESVEKNRDKLKNRTDLIEHFKYEALIKIHARALLISNEILVLLKSGFADGANARWRTLHELAVTSIFLLNNNNDVAERYLEHEVVVIFKEAESYKAHYKKLGYAPLDIKNYNKLKREKERLCNKYKDKFQKDYGWIPSSIIPLKDRHFKGLESHVKIDRFRPLYKFSCASTHGGSRGFYRMGLLNNYQDKILLIGSSNYGLAAPIKNTSISLLFITNCFLVIGPDFETIIQMNILKNFVDTIGPASYNIQGKIEDNEIKIQKG